MNRDISLYIHIPFCLRKCSYCSFVSFQQRLPDIPSYVEALKKDLALHAAGQTVRTIYFGGGTPTMLSWKQIEDILCATRAIYCVDSEAEVTAEANPGTIDDTYLAHLRETGVNRLSLGVQSLDDDDLRLLGRIHTASEAEKAVRAARSSGYANLNLDLIYGLPERKPARWQDILNRALEFAPEHLSLYALTLDDGVPMARSIERGDMPQLDPDQAADEYELAEDLLAGHGYRHYEISNWAKEGYECRHNMVYWQGLPYLGVGVAAHSYMDGRRFASTSDLDEYTQSWSNNAPPALSLDETIGAELGLSEAMILGLRLGEGVNLEDVKSKFGVDVIFRYHKEVDELTGLGLLETRGQRLRLTRRGRLLGNEVFLRFLPQ